MGRSGPSLSRGARRRTQSIGTVGAAWPTSKRAAVNLAACVDALEHAVAAAPRRCRVSYARLSQAHAIAGSARAALEAIEGALASSRTNPTYLRARATLATWVGDYRARTGQLPSAPRALSPATRRLAGLRACQRVGRGHRRGGRAVSAYLARTPSPAVWLELAKAESWRGNYAAALEALDAYRNHVRRHRAYQTRAGGRDGERRAAARPKDLLKPLLGADAGQLRAEPDTRDRAGQAAARREAFESLDTVRTLSPEARKRAARSECFGRCWVVRRVAVQRLRRLGRPPECSASRRARSCASHAERGCPPATSAPGSSARAGSGLDAARWRRRRAATSTSGLARRSVSAG